MAQDGAETFFDEVDTSWSGQNSANNKEAGFADKAAGLGTTGQTGSNPAVLNPNCNCWCCWFCCLQCRWLEWLLEILRI